MRWLKTVALSAGLVLALSGVAKADAPPQPAPGNVNGQGDEPALPGGTTLTTGQGVTVVEQDPGTVTIVQQPGSSAPPVAAAPAPAGVAAPPAQAVPAALTTVTENRPVCDDQGVNGQECTTVDAACPSGQRLLQAWSGPTAAQEVPVGAPFCSGATPPTASAPAPSAAPSDGPPTVEVLITAGKTHAQHTDYPVPAPTLNPGPTTLVNLPTILQAGAGQTPITDALTIHKVACSITAVPHFAWSLPDADTDPLTTDDPGRGFDGTVPADHPDHYVTAVWRTRGQRTVGLTVSWSATMTCQGIAGVLDLGQKVRTFTETTAVDVKEARSVLTGNS